jgi:uncharacterized protein YjbI with pentapeptide repeats
VHSSPLALDRNGPCSPTADDGIPEPGAGATDAVADAWATTDGGDAAQFSFKACRENSDVVHMTQIETSLPAFPDTTIGDMIEADLRATDLTGTDLRGARAARAELAMADLRNADARTMCLVDANLRGARLDGCDLRGADLRGTDLSGASHDASTRWEGALISLRTTLPDDLDLTGTAGAMVIDPRR